jgi:hypothetical protein
MKPIPVYSHRSEISMLRMGPEKYHTISGSLIAFYGGPPPQVLVDASHANRSGGSEYTGICFFIFMLILAIVISVVAIGGIIPATWEVFVFPWTTVIFFIVGLWQDHYAEKHEYMCKYCSYPRCSDRGRDQNLFYCTKWMAKPIPFFFSTFFTGYAVFTTLLLFISHEIWILIISTFLSAIFWGISLLGWIVDLNYYFKKDPIPHAYISPPNHSYSCVCHGTGICPLCNGTGKYTILNQTYPCSPVCPEEKGIEKKGMEHGGCFICIVIILLLLLYYGIWLSGVFFE